MMKVTLRKRPRNNGKISLYLDYYPPIISPKTGKSTRFEYLEMYLYNPPRDEVERKHNREVESMARAIAAERQLDRIAGRYGLSRSSEYDDFLVFYERMPAVYCSNCKQSFPIYASWGSGSWSL